MELLYNLPVTRPYTVWYFEGIIHVNLLFSGTCFHLEQVGFIMCTKVIYDCFLVMRMLGLDLRAVLNFCPLNWAYMAPSVPFQTLPPDLRSIQLKFKLRTSDVTANLVTLLKLQKGRGAHTHKFSVSYGESGWRGSLSMWKSGMKGPHRCPFSGRKCDGAL